MGVDFKDFIKVQEELDNVFKNKSEFCKRTMVTLANSGNFSTDKTIKELCEKVWNVTPVEVPKPALNAIQRVRSASNLTGNMSGDFAKSQSSVGDEDEDYKI